MSKKSDEIIFTVDPQALLKTPTNIEGLDDVLHGGLPSGRLSIINGGPGAGKTVLAMELLVRGTQSGKPAVFISFEESSDAIRRNALAVGWDLARIEEAGALSMINPELDYDAVVSGEFNIEGLCAILEGQARKIGAKIIIIDAVDMLMQMFSNPREAQRQLITFHRWLSKHEFTSVMTVKVGANNQKEYTYLDFMADCVIKLDQRTEEQVTTRRLHVLKYRGSDFASREHPFVISVDGIVVMPLTFVDLVQQSTGKFISTGEVNMDKIFGGGYRKGSSVLISGPSGSGKTTLAFMFSIAAARRGERVLYQSFEQSETTLISEMQSVNLNLETLIDEGNMRIRSIMPESLSMEGHLHRIIKEMEEYKPDHFIVDAISATNRIGSVQAAAEFLIRLYHATKKRGITCIYTNQIFTARTGDLEISGLGISSLVDTGVILNYFREKNRIGRTLLVLKSRATKHSDQYHEFHITDNGIKIAEYIK